MSGPPPIRQRPSLARAGASIIGAPVAAAAAPVGPAARALTPEKGIAFRPTTPAPSSPRPPGIFPRRAAAEDLAAAGGAPGLPPRAPVLPGVVVRRPAGPPPAAAAAAAAPGRLRFANQSEQRAFVYNQPFNAPGNRARIQTQRANRMYPVNWEALIKGGMPARTLWTLLTPAERERVFGAELARQPKAQAQRMLAAINPRALDLSSLPREISGARLASKGATYGSNYPGFLIAGNNDRRAFHRQMMALSPIEAERLRTSREPNDPGRAHSTAYTAHLTGLLDRYEELSSDLDKATKKFYGLPPSASEAEEAAAEKLMKSLDEKHSALGDYIERETRRAEALMAVSDKIRNTGSVLEKHTAAGNANVPELEATLKDLRSQEASLLAEKQSNYEASQKYLLGGGGRHTRRSKRHPKK